MQLRELKKKKLELESGEKFKKDNGFYLFVVKFVIIAADRRIH